MRYFKKNPRASDETDEHFLQPVHAARKRYQIDRSPPLSAQHCRSEQATLPIDLFTTPRPNGML